VIIGGVKFPKALLAAQRDGTLAIFAGAGVSIPEPSNYPNFKDLANHVAAGKLTAGTDEPLDRFLGRLAEANVQVHQLVSRMLNNPNSKPNCLHIDLLRLFPKSESVRIVTTNFDVHFVSAEKIVFPTEERFVKYFVSPFRIESANPIAVSPAA
jgi:NAD-dependent SIR2 family protein deacetylase